jgi:ParB family chromosome partitioning protein
MGSRKFDLDLPELIDLGGLNKEPPSHGVPLQLALDAIDEDPNQPRTDFDLESLQELADSIRERGVRQPVSVKSHPQQPTRYVLNFGARRLRASRMAGRDTIPAFLDETADDFDQIAENEQRKGLTPMELALFVKRKMDAGTKQAEIARKLGKNKATIAQAAALAAAPELIMALYRSGKCQSLRELYDLGQIYGQHPDAVTRAVVEVEAITRPFVEALRTRLTESKTFAGQTIAEPVRPSAAPKSSESFAGQTLASSPGQGEATIAQPSRASVDAPAREAASQPGGAPKRWTLNTKTGAMREAKKGEWVRWSDVEARLRGK